MSNTLSSTEAIDINAIAQYVQVPLQSNEVQQLTKQLVETISFVKNLEEINTLNCVATYSPVGQKNQTFVDGTPQRRQLPAHAYHVPVVINKTIAC